MNLYLESVRRFRDGAPMSVTGDNIGEARAARAAAARQIPHLRPDRPVTLYLASYEGERGIAPGRLWCFSHPGTREYWRAEFGVLESPAPRS